MATLSIVTGGTTGATDGTAVSSGNKLTFTALSPSYITAHVRTDTADTYSSDQAFTIPTGVEISLDGGSTWKGVADSPYTYSSAIGDLNQELRLRQTAIQGSSAATLVTSGTYSSSTALSDVSSFTATANGVTQIDLSWSALTNRTYYTIQRATDSGFTANLTTLTSTLTATSYSDTGLTGSTTYYYRIKGVGTGAYKDSANWVSANATTAFGFTDNFDNSSLDTAKFGTITDTFPWGSVTETTQLNLIDDAVSVGVAAVYLKNEVSLSTAKTYRARCINTGGVDGCNQMTLYGCSGSAPTYSDFSNIDHWIMTLVHRAGGSSTSVYYNTGTWAGTAMTGQTNLGSMSTSNYYDYIIEVAQNTGTWQIRGTIKNNSGTVLSQTSWVNCSSLRSESHYYIVLGRPYQESGFNGSMQVTQFQVS